MKVLSLKEPYATLIKEKRKQIETRSWKTNYRGPLYIHASMTKISKSSFENKELMDLVQNQNFQFGKIICECDLVDCVYMTEKYVNDMRKNNHQEYICGEYAVGRYAWILENIKVLDQPIKAKGNLNIWNFYDEFGIMNLMENIEYGWIDKTNKKRIDEVVCFGFDHYILQNPKETIEHKIGICWDQVELERYYFKGNDYPIKTYFLVYYDNNKCPTHTFLTFEKNNQYYWFEHAWEKFRGIHKYSSKKDLLLDIKKKFIDDQLNNRYIDSNLVLYEYTKPKFHITVQEFYKHCEAGQKIRYDSLE